MQSLFLFSGGNSILHRLDPRPKFLIVVAVLAFVLLFQNVAFMGGAFVAMVIVLWVLGRIPFWNYWKLVALFTPLILAVGLLQAFFFHPPGSTTLLRLGPLSMSDTGLLRGVSIGLRLATMGITFMMFAMTTPPRDVGLALHRAGLPFRYGYLASFGLRFLPLMQDNLRTIQNARAARGDPNVGSRNPLRRIVSLPMSFFPLAATSLRDSNETAIALELRGYGISEDRVTVNDLSMAAADYIMTVVALAIVVLVVYGRFVLQVGTSTV